MSQLHGEANDMASNAVASTLHTALVLQPQCRLAISLKLTPFLAFTPSVVACTLPSFIRALCTRTERIGYLKVLVACVELVAGR